MGYWGDTTIREAQASDIERVLEMGHRFLREGPYSREISSNMETTSHLAHAILSNPLAKILVNDENGNLTGLMVFIVYDHYFSGEKTAGEVIWYVEPEYRNTFTGIALLRAAQRMAREMGATTMQFTAPATLGSDERIPKMYEMLGYHPVETTYARKLCQ